MVKGQRIVVTVGDLAFGGEGVARIEDFVVFVPFVLVGEEVEVEVTEVKKQFARSRLIQVRRAAPDRVTPECRYFGQCGGCQYQHLAYASQLRLKRQQVAEVLARIGGVDPARIQPVVPSPKPYGYRSRIMVRSQWDKYKQGLNFGFVRADSGLVVDVEECRIASPVLNEKLREARLHPPPKGGLKVLLIEAPEGWDAPPDSFFQNNYALLPALVGAARDCLARSRARFLIDAYCGVGFFSLELADQVEAFVGIEYDRRAVQAARHNAARRACQRGEYLEGQVEDRLPGLLGRFPPADTAVLLDPPRTGCRPEILQLLREQRLGQIVYVSCNPATLARDLNALCAEGGYQLQRVTPLDMFPQTRHIECVADLQAGEVPRALPERLDDGSC